MILQSLDNLYDRLKADPAYKVAPHGFSLQKIAFRVVLTREGDLWEIQDVRDLSSGRPRPQQMMVPGGAKKSGSGLNPCFLWDNTGYMLGTKPDDADPERTKETFEAFRRKHLEAEAQIDSMAFSAVCRFLESWDPIEAKNHPILDEITAGFGIFQVRGETSYVHQGSEVTAWWERHAGEDGAVEKGQCLIRGEMAPIATTHPKIKGVRGTQSSGAAIVSFNESAYESYGKEQSHNAPVSEAAAFRYTTALNALLDGPMRDKHRLQVGDTTVAFWTAKPSSTEDIFVQFAQQGSRSLEADEVQDEALRQKLEAFLRALREGREAYAEIEEDPDTTPYFVLGLSPNAARISARFFHRSTLSELLETLRRHYRDIRIEPQPARGKRRGDPEFPQLGCC